MIVRIEYESHGLNFYDRMWTAIMPDEEALDYGTKEYLKDVCKKHGYGYEVIRNHKDGRRTVLERYNPLR